MAKAKTKKYTIEKRVAEEMGMTATQIHRILDTFFDVLKEECSVLECEEFLTYKWLKFECKQTADRVMQEHMIGWRGEAMVIPGKLVIKPKINASFYADKKKGVQSNWGS